ncbi:MAG: universal stress protein [Candidatus Nitrosotenuis sp.]
MNIKRILAPVDGSENSLRALKHALELAKQCQASVIALHVITDMSLFTAVHAIIVSEEKWPKYVRDLMKDVRKLAQKYTVPFEEIVIGGRMAGYDIVTFANSRTTQIDVIVIAKRGLGFPKEIFLGSTTNFVLNKSAVPVLLVK